jgi:hypothetical protein
VTLDLKLIYFKLNYAHMHSKYSSKFLNIAWEPITFTITLIVLLFCFNGFIYPSQGIVLYFPITILESAKVQLPVRGPLALHFLRSDQRAILDPLDASQQNKFGKALSLTNTTFPNSTMFNDNFDFSRDYINQFGRLIPYDFVNQVIPVIFKITGEEWLDVVTLPSGGKDAVKDISTQIVQITNGVTSTVRLAVRNTGDIPIWDLTVNVFPGLQSAHWYQWLESSCNNHSKYSTDPLFYNPTDRNSGSIVLWHRRATTKYE